MITKEITLCGRQVTLAYCFATEIAFRDLSGEDMTDFISEAVSALQSKRMPDIKKTIFAILAAITAQYSYSEEEPPVNSAVIMNECTPEEFGTAIGTLITLRAQFYHIPAGEPQEKEEQGTEQKNA
ncbi:MAG: hypothetical protein IKK92_05615 [Prevotella sp.]|nr:hypothetical protein [Prevotella sp.]